jgi:hypothetical protein
MRSDAGMISGVCTRVREKSKRFCRPRGCLVVDPERDHAIAKPDVRSRGHRGILSGPNRLCLANGWNRLIRQEKLSARFAEAPQRFAAAAGVRMKPKVQAIWWFERRISIDEDSMAERMNSEPQYRLSGL